MTKRRAFTGLSAVPGMRTLAPERSARTTQSAGSGSVAFCARCARRPARDAPERSRVCRDCGLGLVLQAPAAIAPPVGGAFLVIDRELRISALSQAAQDLFGLSEVVAAGQWLVSLLSPVGSAPHERADFLASLRAAADGLDAVRHFHVRLLVVDGVAVLDGGQTRDREPVRVGPCSPPPAALLTLQAPPARTPAGGSA